MLRPIQAYAVQTMMGETPVRAVGWLDVVSYPDVLAHVIVGDPADAVTIEVPGLPTPARIVVIGGGDFATIPHGLEVCVIVMQRGPSSNDDVPARSPHRSRGYRRGVEKLMGATSLTDGAACALADRLEGEGLDPHALLIARGGRIVFETAWAPYRRGRPALVYSASKTYASLAIGFLADEECLALDECAGDLLGEQNPAGITVRHLLTMNTGHSNAQIDAIGSDPRELLRVVPEQAPGSFFAYNSPATHALSLIVTTLTGEPLTSYLRPRLLDPLGIGPRWMRSFGVVEHGASGFHLTVEDLARTATMLAHGGAFAGRQVVPAWYVEEMSRPWSDTSAFDGPASAEGEVNDWSLGYGYQVWRSRHGFRLDGAAGQYGLVLPEHDLVIGYQGATLDTQAVLRAIWDFVETVDAAASVPLGDATSGGGGGSGGLAGLSAGSAGAGFAGAGGTAPCDLRDSWDGRERFDVMTSFDDAAVRIIDTADGWAVALPGVGELPVGEQWREHVCRTQAGSAPEAPRVADDVGSPCRRNVRDVPDTQDAATRLTLATRGELRTDGSVLIHVVDTTSPHRAIVRREPGGAVRAGWHIPPVGGRWEALRVPESVTRVHARAAALLLDMDGTLVDSHAVVERLWTQWALDHGVDPARALAIIHGRQGQDSMALLLPGRPHEENLAENRALLAAETAQTDGVVALPGAARLLAELVGLPHALVTSATRELAHARMDAAGLPVPALAVTAEDVARSKPDPEGFLVAAAALGVEPAACIVVEDSANGIAAGRAAGMRVIGVGPHASETPETPEASETRPTWVVADASGIHVSPGADGAIAVTIDA
ncbi:MAG: HAD-IA family hydrolase [Microbacterium sp.]